MNRGSNKLLCWNATRDRYTFSQGQATLRGNDSCQCGGYQNLGSIYRLAQLIFFAWLNVTEAHDIIRRLFKGT